MGHLLKKEQQFLPFMSLITKKGNSLEQREKSMLCVKLKKFFIFSVMLFFVSSILFATNSYAADGALFSDLTDTGIEIFGGMREIIYAVSGFGIVAIAVGAFFGGRTLHLSTNL